MQPQDRIALSQWTLDKQLDWIAAADAKVGVTVAIDTAMLAGLAAAWSEAGPVHHCMHIAVSACSAAFTVLSLAAAALAFTSRISGPVNSLFFFGRISERSATTYCQELNSATEQTVLDDLALQIHRNAEIARDKHLWASRSTQLGFLGGFFLVIAALLLLK